INNGLFRFVQSAPNANGAALASFTFQVQDDGGTLNGGVYLDPSPDTLTINVTPVNDPPSGTDNVINPALNGALVEDSHYMFAAADFGFNDFLDSPADSFLSVKITTLPASGTLLLKGAPVAPGQEALVSDIGLGGLVYQPPANANGAALGVFSFQVRDSGGTANG